MKTFFAVFLGALVGFSIGSIIVRAIKFSSAPNLGSITNSYERNVPRIDSPQVIHAFVTAYDPYDEACVGEYAHVWPRKTATGTDAEKPGAAADLSVIPAGTRLDVPGMGSLVVDDDGKDMRNAAKKFTGAFYWIDIRIPADYKDSPDPETARKNAHHAAARQGAHWMDVYVTPPANP